MTDRKHEGRAVRKEIRIHAPADAVYDAWAKPEQIARWFVDRAYEEMRTGATVTWRFEAFDMELPIEVYEAEPGARLLFGGERPGRPPALQEIVLEQDGGTTVLRLVNSGFLEGEDWDEEFQGVDSGWELALAQLRQWLEHHADAERSEHLLAMRPAPFDYDALQPSFRTASGLERWLGDAATCNPEPLQAGARLRIRIDGTLDLDGEVLAASPRELLVAWPEQRGVLALKAFAAGPDTRMVGLDFRAWDPEAGAVPEVRQHLEAAIDRLAAALAS